MGRARAERLREARQVDPNVPGLQLQAQLPHEVQVDVQGEGRLVRKTLLEVEGTALDDLAPATQQMARQQFPPQRVGAGDLGMQCGRADGLDDGPRVQRIDR